MQSFNALAADYEKATGKKLEITHVPRAQYEAAVAKDEGDAISALLLGWDTGKGVVAPTQDGLANSLWPEWKPKKAVEVLIASAA